MFLIDMSYMFKVADIKKYFEDLPELQQKHRDLTMHVNIATEIKKETAKHDFRKTIETEQSKKFKIFETIVTLF